MTGLIERRLRGNRARCEFGLPLDAELIKGDVGLGGLHRSELRPVQAFEGIDLVCCSAELRLRPSKRDAIGFIVEAEEYIAGFDTLVVMNLHGGNNAGNIGCDGYDVGLDVGIVGGDPAPAA